ncbi:hypothetical protein Tco_0303901, partial [Tanacetum coccineum]
SPSKVSFEAVGVSDTHDDAAPKCSNLGGSFASLLKPKEATNKVHFRTLVNDESVVSADCVLPKDAAAKVKGRYENSIVGFFLGKDPSFPVVQQYVSNTWRKFGFERITRNDDGVYLFKFATKSGRDQVIEKGPWLIRKSPIILSKWSPSVSLKRGEVTKVPVWVKMYNVPVLAYSEDGLSLLGTQIGKPIMLDAFTSSMCVESWGRISFARALIEIDAEEIEKDSTAVKSRKKNKGANFTGIRMNKPKSTVMWQKKKSADPKASISSPSGSSNIGGNGNGKVNGGSSNVGNGVLNSELETANPFDVLKCGLNRCNGDFHVSTKGLGHNLFSVGQFCDSDLEVAFRKHTCFVRNLEGVDLLSGSRGSNLYTISMADMMKSSPICLLSKASKAKSWLWHRRLSHLKFVTINKLAK